MEYFDKDSTQLKALKALFGEEAVTEKSDRLKMIFKKSEEKWEKT
jgi:hypothetical protein